MYIFATFYGDDNFSHIINTNKLEKSLKDEIERDILRSGKGAFSGYEYFDQISNAAIKPSFPMTIDGMIDVYLE